jgi:hypothetical protein
MAGCFVLEVLPLVLLDPVTVWGSVLFVLEWVACTVGVCTSNFTALTAIRIMSA